MARGMGTPAIADVLPDHRRVVTCLFGIGEFSAFIRCG